MTHICGSSFLLTVPSWNYGSCWRIMLVFCLWSTHTLCPALSPRLRVVHCYPWPSEETQTLSEEGYSNKRQKRASRHPRRSDLISKGPITIIKCIWILSLLRKQCTLDISFYLPGICFNINKFSFIFFHSYFLVDLAFCETFIDLLTSSWIACTCVSEQLSGLSPFAMDFRDPNQVVMCVWQALLALNYPCASGADFYNSSNLIPDF